MKRGDHCDYFSPCALGACKEKGSCTSNPLTLILFLPRVVPIPAVFLYAPLAQAPWLS